MEGLVPDLESGVGVEFGSDEVGGLEVAGHARSWFEAVALEFAGDVSGGQFFVTGSGAASGQGVAGEEGFVCGDPLGLDGPGLLGSGGDGSCEKERGSYTAG